MIGIGKRLKEERQRLGASQEEMASKAGVTRSPYVAWEAGKTFPTALQLATLAEVGLDVLYVVTGIRSSTSDLKPDEAALVDNYRHSPPEAQAAIKATSAAFAQSATTMKKGKAA